MEKEKMLDELIKFASDLMEDSENYAKLAKDFSTEELAEYFKGRTYASLVFLQELREYRK